MSEDFSQPADAKLLEVMLYGVEDVTTAARSLGMTPADIARWASSLDTRRAVAGMRMLADVQAELALSRMRVHAVNRLARLTLDDEAPVETGRKTAQAILCLSMERVAARMPERGDPDDDHLTAMIDQMREALYGELPTDPAKPKDSDPSTLPNDENEDDEPNDDPDPPGDGRDPGDNRPPPNDGGDSLTSGSTPPGATDRPSGGAAVAWPISAGHHRTRDYLAVAGDSVSPARNL